MLICRIKLCIPLCEPKFGLPQVSPSALLNREVADPGKNGVEGGIDHASTGSSVDGHEVLEVVDLAVHPPEGEGGVVTGGTRDCMTEGRRTGGGGW